jgi:molybdenum cofactor cytidylyltransferase
MRFAVVPAAGRSRRMGRPKLALPLGGRTILEHVIAALRQAGVEHVLVVVGPQVPELVPLAEQAGAHVVQLDDETSGMRETVEHGLRRLEEHFQPRSDDAWLLVPADHPTLTADVVRRLAGARAAHPEHTIFVPTHDGRRGHPLLITWDHVAGIRAHPPGQGLNAYVRGQVDRTMEVPVAQPGVLGDLDTPEEYAQLLSRWEGPD